MMMVMVMSKHVTGVASGRTLDLFIPLMMERPTFHDDDDDVDDDDYNAKYKYTQTRQRVIMRLMPSGSLITTFQFHPLLSSL